MIKIYVLVSLIFFFFLYTYRSDCEHIKNVVAPFDWTFTTAYRGTTYEEKPNTLQVTYFNSKHSKLHSRQQKHQTNEFDSIFYR